MTDSHPMSQLIGKTFGDRFLIEKHIGRGGMGSVFLARHLTMGKSVALKVLARHLSEEPPQVRRFNQEAQNSSRLRHPNTIRVFDFGTSDEGYLYLAMEYLEGLELSKVLRRDAPLSAERTVHILTQVVKSLAEAHSIGLIHRDVKPDNIFLSDVYGERDFVKVLDFGIAKVVNAEELANLTQTGYICGTPTYLAPELAMGTSITPAADIYSMGVVAYEMLTGRPPFRAETPIAVVMKHIHDRVPPFVPDLPAPERLKALIWQMLAKDPTARPASAEALLASLETVFDAATELDGPFDAGAPVESGIEDASSVEASPLEGASEPTRVIAPIPHTLGSQQRNAQTNSIPNPTGPQSLAPESERLPWLPLLGASAAGAMLVAILMSWPTGDKEAAMPPVTGVTQAPAAVPEPPAAVPEAPAQERVKATAITRVVPVAQGTVAVESTPPGATIYEGDTALGQTPTEIGLPSGADERRALTIRLEGYEDSTLMLGQEAKPIHVDMVAVTPSAPAKSESVQRSRSGPARKGRAGQSRSRKSKSKSSDRWRDFER